MNVSLQFIEFVSGLHKSVHQRSAKELQNGSLAAVARMPPSTSAEFPPHRRISIASFSSKADYEETVLKHFSFHLAANSPLTLKVQSTEDCFRTLMICVERSPDTDTQAIPSATNSFPTKTTLTILVDGRI